MPNVSMEDAQNVQQDAISRCGHLEYNDIGICEMWTSPECTGTNVDKCNILEGVRQGSLKTLVGVSECIHVLV